MDIEKRGLEFIANLMAKCHISYEIKRFYPWLKSPKGYAMQLDIYLPKHCVAIEIDGKHHYRWPNKYHKSYKQFLYQKQCDKRKEEILRNRGVELIRIRGKMLKALIKTKGNPDYKLLKEKLYVEPSFNKQSTVKKNKEIIVKCLFDYLNWDGGRIKLRGNVKTIRNRIG